MDHDTNDSGDTETTERQGLDQTPVRHSWAESEQPSVAIVEAVSAATGRQITELPPLQEGADPDAVDALLTGGQSSQLRISFSYAGTSVVVEADGTIEVRSEAADEA